MIQLHHESLPPEATPEFAAAWRAHRKLTQSIHEETLYPEITKRLDRACGGRIVDLGCGGGQLAARIVADLKPRQMIAVDINPELCRECAKRCGPFVEILCQGIGGNLRIPRHSIDAIVCSNVTMHLNDDEVLRTFKSITDMLQAEGVAIVTFTHPQWAQRHYTRLGHATLPLVVQTQWNDCAITQWHREEAQYLALASAAGLALKDRGEICIADLPDLPQRYRLQVGEPLFCVWELERPPPNIRA